MFNVEEDLTEEDGEKIAKSEKAKVIRRMDCMELTLVVISGFANAGVIEAIKAKTKTEKSARKDLMVRGVVRLWIVEERRSASCVGATPSDL